MGQFDSLGADIATALNSAGVTTNITHTSVAAGTRNLSTGVTTNTDTPRTIKAAVGTCKRELRQGIGVEAGDLRVTVLAPEFTTAPTLRDKFTVRSQPYAVMAINVAEIGGALVSYTLQLRRA